MKKSTMLFAALALVGAPLVAQTGTIVAGKPIFTNDGKRIGVVYRVTSEGAAQLILNGKLITIPAASISAADGKYQTNLSKKELVSAS